MSILEHLNPIIFADVLMIWCVQDILTIDSAICNSVLRTKFLQIVQSPCFIIRTPNDDTNRHVRWMINRNIKWGNLIVKPCVVQLFQNKRMNLMGIEKLSLQKYFSIMERKTRENKNALTRFINACPRLKTICLSNETVLPKDVIRNILPTTLKQLTSLKLHNFKPLSEECLTYLSENCKNLVEFAASACFNNSGSIFERFIVNNPGLETIILCKHERDKKTNPYSRCLVQQHTDSLLLAISNSCPKIRKIDIQASNANFSTAAAATLITESKSLTSFKLSVEDDILISGQQSIFHCLGWSCLYLHSPGFSDVGIEYHCRLNCNYESSNDCHFLEILSPTAPQSFIALLLSGKLPVTKLKLSNATTTDLTIELIIKNYFNSLETLIIDGPVGTKCSQNVFETMVKSCLKLRHYESGDGGEMLCVQGWHTVEETDSESEEEEIDEETAKAEEHEQALNSYYIREEMRIAEKAAYMEELRYVQMEEYGYVMDDEDINYYEY